MPTTAEPSFDAIVDRISEVATVDVERRLVTEVYEDQLVRLSSDPRYQAFEKAVVDRGWPARGEGHPERRALAVVEDTTLKAGKQAQIRVVSGLFLLAAARKLQRAELPMVILTRDEVPVWQGAVQVPDIVVDENDDDLLYRSRASRAAASASSKRKGSAAP